MGVVDEAKLIQQTKTLRLVCYKAHKYGNTPDGACPFGFTEIRPTCKNCVWFRILDLSRQNRALMSEREIVGTDRLAIEHLAPPIALTDEEVLK